MNRKKFRLLPLIMVAIYSVTGCSEKGSPTPQATDKEMNSIEHFTYTAPDGLKVAAMKSGEGRRIIFVHGTPGEKEGWADYLLDPPFKGEYIAIDRLGFGQSEPDNAVTSLKEQANALLPLLKPDAKGQLPILVGHSLGGPIVLQAALLYPKRIGALVFVAGAFDPDLEEIHFLQPVGEMWPIRALLPRSIRNANRELLALEPQLREMSTQISKLSVPTVVLQGGKDGLVPASNVDFLKKHLNSNSDIVYTLKEDGDHFVVWNDKPWLDQALLKAQALSEKSKS